MSESRQHVKGLGVSYRCSFDFDHLGEVVFIVDTVSKHVAKCSERSFQRVGCALFLGLFECCRFSLAIFDVTVPNIL